MAEPLFGTPQRAFPTAWRIIHQIASTVEGELHTPCRHDIRALFWFGMMFRGVFLAPLSSFTGTARSIFFCIAENETPKEHATFHTRIALPPIDMQTGSINLVRTTPTTHFLYHLSFSRNGKGNVHFSRVFPYCYRSISCFSCIFFIPRFSIELVRFFQDRRVVPGKNTLEVKDAEYNSAIPGAGWTMPASR